MWCSKRISDLAYHFSTLMRRRVSVVLMARTLACLWLVFMQQYTLPELVFLRPCVSSSHARSIDIHARATPPAHRPAATCHFTSLNELQAHFRCVWVSANAT
eukprot:COSAG01_NODE_6931_length_3435_cov_18.212530_5_plen_102_part_00